MRQRHPPTLLLFFFFFFFAILASSSSSSSMPDKKDDALSSTKEGIINSNSILVALLDSSHYTELSQLLDKALLLHTLDQAVSTHNITIFAPTNDALRRDFHPFFFLHPANLKSLQNLLLFHIIPARIPSHQLWPLPLLHHHHHTLCGPDAHGDKLSFSHKNGHNFVATATVIKSDDVVRPDGIIHRIDRLLVPKSVQQDFNARRSLTTTSAVLPEGAPVVDPRTSRLKKPAPPVPVVAPPVLPIFDAMAPGPSLAPAPAPGPGGPHHHFDGESQVKDFIQTLVHYGGYNELADILVNLTSMATEMAKLVSEGYVLTVLAPNDEAMAKLTTDQLSEPRAPEQIMYYHLVPEYQTEESMYNAVRRFGKVKYETLRLQHKVVAEEADGSVKFGQGEGSAYLFDPDIYTDGRISVQGIDGVLFPPEESKSSSNPNPSAVAKIASKPRRGKLLEMACNMLWAVGLQDSHLPTCH